MQTQYDIFISYSRQDTELALKIHKALESEDLICWIDKNIKPAEIWRESISDGITNSQFFLLILTSNSALSPEVLKEVKFASEKEKPIYCLKTEKFELLKGSDLEKIISNIQYIEAHSLEIQTVIENLVKQFRESLRVYVEPHDIKQLGGLSVSGSGGNPKEQERDRIKLLEEGVTLYKKRKYVEAIYKLQRFQDIYNDTDTSLLIVFIKNYFSPITKIIREMEKPLIREGSNTFIVRDKNNYIKLLKSKTFFIPALIVDAVTGNAFSQNLLGELYLLSADGSDNSTKWGEYKLTQENAYKKALEFFMKASENRIASASQNVGILYQNGLGVEKNMVEANKWFDKAKSQGFGYKSEYSKTNLIDDFIKTPKEIYNQPIEDNSITAKKAQEYYDLGIKLYDEKKYSDAYTHLLKAADLGHAGGQNDIGCFYIEGLGVKQDYKVAIQWLLKASENGNVSAKNNIGWMYMNGLGVSQNADQAMQWLLKAIDGGNIDAVYNIGFMYHNGVGVKQDYVQAMQWYLRASEKGSIKAQNNIGALYFDGKGVKQDKKVAKEWLLKSANQGNETAKRWLKNNYSIKEHSDGFWSKLFKK